MCSTRRARRRGRRVHTSQRKGGCSRRRRLAISLALCAGKGARTRKEFEEAEALAREAVQIAAETGLILWGADTLMDLADVLRAAGRVDEAIPPIQDALALYEAKGDVVSSAKARAHLTELQLGRTRVG